MRMLRFTAAIMVFLDIVRAAQDGLPELAIYVNTVNFMLLLFGLMSYFAAYLIEQKQSVGYIPIAVATLYPLSVSLTTGQPLNIVIIIYGAFVLFQYWRLRQSGYFKT